MNLIALPAFTDNYNRMLDDGRQAILADPGESAPVIAALDAQPLVMAAILVTRDHADRLGTAAARIGGAQVHGPATEEPVAVPTALRQWKNDFR